MATLFNHNDFHLPSDFAGKVFRAMWSHLPVAYFIVASKDDSWITPCLGGDTPILGPKPNVKALVKELNACLQEGSIVRLEHMPFHEAPDRMTQDGLTWTVPAAILHSLGAQHPGKIPLLAQDPYDEIKGLQLEYPTYDGLYVFGHTVRFSRPMHLLLNINTHDTYIQGADTPQEVIKGAAERGFFYNMFHKEVHHEWLKDKTATTAYFGEGEASVSLLREVEAWEELHGKQVRWDHRGEVDVYNVFLDTTREDERIYLKNVASDNLFCEPCSLEDLIEIAASWGDEMTLVPQSPLNPPEEDLQYLSGHLMTPQEAVLDPHRDHPGILQADGNRMFLSHFLLGSQRRSLGHQKALIRIHTQMVWVKKELMTLVGDPLHTPQDIAIAVLLDKVETLDTLLQMVWGFPTDAKQRIHWRQIPGCTCTQGREGERNYSPQCPYHKYQNPLYLLQVEPTSMLISGFGPQSYRDAKEALEECVLRGTITDHYRELFEKWRVACGFDDRQGLLMMSTAFPQRLALSLLEARG